MSNQQNDGLYDGIGAQPFSFHQTRTMDGSQSRWQVDTSQLRQHLEHNLKGEKYKEVIERVYVLESIEPPPKELTKFWSETDTEAEQKLVLYCDQQDHPITKTILKRTELTRTKEEWVRVKSPLCNDIGCYHLLSVIDSIFSKVGYLSNLSDEEINDMVWEDVLVPLVTTIVANHDLYGIGKGSRDELRSLFTSTAFLVLKAAKGGWTGQGLRESTREVISTREEPKKKSFGVF